MIKLITWDVIKEVWANFLWPVRSSPIESNSAMSYLGGYSSYNMNANPTFFGYYVDGTLAGVNSGHMCEHNQYRSRGLHVFDKYRGQGFGVELLLATVNQAKIENADLIWSLPRQSSWKTYSRAGFVLSSDWFKTETSESNAYCVLKFK